MRSFRNVAISFPLRPGVLCARDSNVEGGSWAPWSQGELRIDTASFGVFFTPSGSGQGGGFVAKPLGCLTGISKDQGEDKQACVFWTTDLVHGSLRATFASPADKDDFVKLTRGAEALMAQRRRTLAMTPGRLGGQVGDGIFRDAEQFRAVVTQQFVGRAPLIYTGAELYGPYVHEDGQTTEVFMGRGAVVLLDPDSTAAMGNYEMLFLSEDNLVEPLIYTSIGPRTRLARQPPEGEEACAVAFDISLHGETGRSLAFDEEAEAAQFARDFHVRQRLMCLSLRTARGSKAVELLRGELAELRRSGIPGLLRRLLALFVVLSLALVVMHAVAMFVSGEDRGVVSVATSAVRDAGATGFAIMDGLTVASGLLCRVVTQAIPASTVRECLKPFEDAEVRHCLRMLVL